MRRFLMDDLVKWKTSSRMKPLILNGARQVGKTWLLKEFGSRHFENTAYVNFDNNPGLQRQFDIDYDVDRLLLVLQAETGQTIMPEETLIVFDEIQECPKALTSLKYFQEQKPQYCIAAAGSLLGLIDHQGSDFPVGKANQMHLYPLSYREYLDACGGTGLLDLLESGDWNTVDAFTQKYISHLKTYFYVGGMPEAVKTYIDTENFEEVRTVQEDILYGYERDISKHLRGSEVEYVLSAWSSIPRHLAQENKKFIFGHIRESARARDYKSAIKWLTAAGIATKVERVAKPALPLASYAEESIFKLFVVDVGLFGAMSDLGASAIVDGSSIFTEFKGAMTEQYVCQQLISDCGLTPFYWSSNNSQSEIDFIVQKDSKIYPIEVEAEQNLRSKSLRTFSNRFEGLCPLRFSMADYKDQGWMKNIPLYAIHRYLG